MRKLLGFLAKTKAVVQRNPILLAFFLMQMVLQSEVAGRFMQLNGWFGTLVMSFALAAAHLIPAYSVYVLGDGTGLAKAPGLISKVGFMLLGAILASVLAASFTCGVFGIACQPFLQLVISPSINAVGMAALVASALGSLVDVIAIAAIFAFGGLGDE